MSEKGVENNNTPTSAPAKTFNIITLWNPHRLLLVAAKLPNWHFPDFYEFLFFHVSNTSCLSQTSLIYYT